jgi:CubicO group peptidase (beta-lactamase class C family)
VLPELANPVVVTGHDEAGNPLTTPAKGKITFGQLLNHSSGIEALGLKRSRPNGELGTYLRASEDLIRDYGLTGVSDVYEHRGEDVAKILSVLKVVAIYHTSIFLPDSGVGTGRARILVCL